jgi:hypothetical protein
VPDKTLELWQTLLKVESDNASFADAIRGQRAFSEHMYQRRLQGRIPGWLLNSWEYTHPNPYETGWQALDNVTRKLNNKLKEGSPTENLAGVLQADTDLIEISRLPAEQQPAAIQAIQPKWAKLPSGSATMAYYLERHLDHIAHLRCMLTALAVERFRLAEGHWPENLAELSPRFLPQVPNDVFGTAAPNYVRLPDGVLIYSSKGNGQIATDAAKMKFPGGQGKDNLRIRLWDPDKRHVPAPVPKMNSADSARNESKPPDKK